MSHAAARNLVPTAPAPRLELLCTSVLDETLTVSAKDNLALLAHAQAVQAHDNDITIEVTAAARIPTSTLPRPLVEDDAFDRAVDDLERILISGVPSVPRMTTARQPSSLWGAAQLAASLSAASSSAAESEHPSGIRPCVTPEDTRAARTTREQARLVLAETQRARGLMRWLVLGIWGMALTLVAALVLVIVATPHAPAASGDSTTTTTAATPTAITR